jgi:hypothetical protein
MAIGLAAILGVVDAIGKVAGAINGIYELVKNAEEFFNGSSDWDQVRAVVSSEIIGRNQILQASTAILGAIEQLDQRLFLERISDKSGDSDQALLAFDTWQRNPEESGQRDIALNESAGALADMLQYFKNNVYPGESLVFPLTEILTTRLLILKGADPQFVRSSLRRQPIEDAINFIRITANNIETAIRQANTVKDDSYVRRVVRNRPREEGGGREQIILLHISVSYQNLSATVSYQRHTEYAADTDRSAREQLQQVRDDANAARLSGLAADMDRARVSVLREIADTAERCLRTAEAMLISNKILRRRLTAVERAWFIMRRQRSSFRETTFEFVTQIPLEKELQLDEQRSLRILAADILDQPLSKDQEVTLSHVARSFGKKAVLQIMLNHSDSLLNKDESAGLPYSLMGPGVGFASLDFSQTVSRDSSFIPRFRDGGVTGESLRDRAASVEPERDGQPRPDHETRVEARPDDVCAAPAGGYQVQRLSPELLYEEES